MARARNRKPVSGNRWVRQWLTHRYKVAEYILPAFFEHRGTRNRRRIVYTSFFNFTLSHSFVKCLFSLEPYFWVIIVVWEFAFFGIYSFWVSVWVYIAEFVCSSTSPGLFCPAVFEFSCYLRPRYYALFCSLLWGQLFQPYGLPNGPLPLPRPRPRPLPLLLILLPGHGFFFISCSFVRYLFNSGRRTCTDLIGDMNPSWNELQSNPRS